MFVYKLRNICLLLSYRQLQPCSVSQLKIGRTKGLELCVCLGHNFLNLPIHKNFNVSLLEQPALRNQ